MIEFSIIWSIFLTGLALAWGPCIATCSFILAPYAVSTKEDVRAGLRSVIYFSAGRIISYTLLGGISGYSGSVIRHMFYASKFKMYMNISVSALIFLIGLSILIRGYRENRVCNFIHDHDFFNMFLTGVFIGIVPCTPLFAILAIIILKVSGFLSGALLGLVFGAGTFLSPLFFIVAGSIFFSKKIFISKRLLVGFQRICGVVMMVIALFVFATNTVFNLNV